MRILGIVTLAVLLASSGGLSGGGVSPAAALGTLPTIEVEEVALSAQSVVPRASKPERDSEPVEAVGVIVQFEEQPSLDVPTTEAEAIESVEQVIDADALLAEFVPEVESAENLGNGLFSVTLEETVTAGEVLDIVEALEESISGAAVEPDWVIQLDTPRSELFESSATQISPPWGLDRIDQLELPLNNEYSFETSPGIGVLVYVVDTGVRATHVDLSGRVDSIGGFSAFDDGWGSGDCHGHGTHVAGTIAGTQSGVAKQAVIVPVRVLDCSGTSSMSLIISGLDWVLDDALNYPGPKVVNMSLGGSYSYFLNRAVAELVAAGIPVVVASGNSGQNACGTSPASESSAITVNSSDAEDRDSVFSNFGPCTDIYAPGEGIISAGISSDTAFISLDGTSMAAPHVAGAVAILLSEGASGYSDFESILKSKNLGVINSGLTGDPTSLLYTGAFSGPSTSPPTISGDAVVGQTLTAGVSGWSPTPTSLSYQWLLNGKPISRATSSTYVVGSRDAGKTISVRVVGTRTGYLPETVVSVATGMVLRGYPFDATSVPSVSGDAVVGQTLTASVAEWTPAASVSYQWLLNGKPISRATSSTYVVGSRDAGKKISVRVVGSKTSYVSATVVSVATGMVLRG